MTIAISEGMEKEVKLFDSWEQASEEYYKSHDCMSDDVDKEDAAIERWIEGIGYELKP